jgi:cyclophilin family peptidyl-prolyl cis-trans isomerase/HEAT repeat protein
MRLVDDPEASVRGAAALAVVRMCGDRLRRRPGTAGIAPVDVGAVAAELVRRLGAEPSPGVRWRHCYAIAHLGEPAAAPALRAAVESMTPTTHPDERWVRLFALRGLGALPASPSNRAVLLRALRDADPALAAEAAVALASPDRQLDDVRRRQPAPPYDDAEVAAALSDVAATPGDHRVRSSAARELWRYADGPGRADVERTLDSLARTAEPALRAVALESLARIAGPRDDAPWTTAAENADWRVRQAAARAVAWRPTDAGLDRLRRLAADADVRVRTAVLESLAAFAARDDARALVATLARERDPALRETLATTARSFPAAPTVEMLRDALADSPGPEFADARRSLAETARALGASAPAEAPAPAGPMTLLDEHVPPELLATRPVLALATTRGEVEITLLPEVAPVHCFSLLQLVARGDYDGREFHRVVTNFVVQGGDARGDGFGASAWHGGHLRDEINPLEFLAGVVGMPKSAEPDSGGDQLFVVTVPTPHLDGRYTAFAKVTNGMDVIERIEVGDRILSARQTR